MVSLLTDNYLKAYRREKTMLAINLFCIALALASFAVCSFVFDSVFGLLVAVVSMVALRSVLSEIAVGRVIGKTAGIVDLVSEAILSVGFILSARLFSLPLGAGVYAALFTVYLLLHLGDLRTFLRRRKSSETPNGEEEID